VSRLSIQYQCIARHNPQLHQQHPSYRLIIIGDKSALEPNVSVEDTPLLRRAFAYEISIQFQKVTGRLSKTHLSQRTILLSYIRALGLETEAVTVNRSGEYRP